MKERILEFLRAENKSSAQLAEEIGVQPSGISHILSGRNNPSLDFVLKMLEKYKNLSTEWLLFGKGSMYKVIQMPTLFDDISDINIDNSKKQLNQVPDKSILEFPDSAKYQPDKVYSEAVNNNTPGVQKIVWFYANNTFEEYFPRH